MAWVKVASISEDKAESINMEQNNFALSKIAKISDRIYFFHVLRTMDSLLNDLYEELSP